MPEVTKPRFKLDGRAGTMRWTHADGSKRTCGSSLSTMPFLAAQQVVAGTGRDFECRTVARRGRTKWHPLRMTFAEANDYLAADWQFALTHRKCQTIRERRRLKGRPLFLIDDYERTAA